MRSGLGIEHVRDNNYRFVQARDSAHHGYALHGAERFMLPIAQIRPADYDSKLMLLQSHRLQTMTDAGLQLSMWAFASYLREFVYNREFVDGDCIHPAEGDEEFEVLKNIGVYLNGGADDARCEELGTILNASTMGFDLARLRGYAARYEQSLRAMPA